MPLRAIMDQKNTAAPEGKEDWVADDLLYLFDQKFVEDVLDDADRRRIHDDVMRLWATTAPRIDRGYMEKYVKPGLTAQLGLGPKGTGAPFHYHMPAVNLLVDGQKRWALIPPSVAWYSRTHPNNNRVSATAEKKVAESGSLIRRCTQEKGDLVFVPEFWGHEVLNLEGSLAIAVEIAPYMGTSLRLRFGTHGILMTALQHRFSHLSGLSHHPGK